MTKMQEYMSQSDLKWLFFNQHADLILVSGAIKAAKRAIESHQSKVERKRVIDRLRDADDAIYRLLKDPLSYGDSDNDTTTPIANSNPP